MGNPVLTLTEQNPMNPTKVIVKRRVKPQPRGLRSETQCGVDVRLLFRPRRFTPFLTQLGGGALLLAGFYCFVLGIQAWIRDRTQTRARGGEGGGGEEG